VGELLFAAVAAAREADVDPEVALRVAATRFRASVEAADAAARGQADLADE
jgi:XTP/dITP diphosphohydrolase